MKKKVPFAPNAKERETGVGIAPMVEGCLQFGKLYKTKGDNERLLREEWVGRFRERTLAEGRVPSEIEIKQQESLSITDHKRAIKEDEIRRKREEGAELSSDEAKFFTPIYTAYDDYVWDAVTKL